MHHLRLTLTFPALLTPAMVLTSPLLAAEAPHIVLLKPARVFDGVSAQPTEGLAVLVQADRITKIAPASSLKPPPGATVINLPKMTLLPGLIEAHAHLLLHPYNETSWDDQVLREPLALRVARATN